jgi:hypothetical protein
MREMLTLLRIIDQTVDEKTPKPLEAADTIAVTCLLGDLTWLMNIYDMLKASDRKLILHIPSKIWLDSSTLEQAYTDYEKQIRLTAKLKKLGIEIRYGSGKSTQARLLAAYLASRGFKVKVVWVKSFHTLAYVLSRLYQKLSPRSVELNMYGHIIRIKPLCQGKLRRPIWAWIEFISIAPKIFIEVYLPSLVGKTIVAERYLIDSVVSIAYALDDDKFDSGLLLSCFYASSPRALC